MNLIDKYIVAVGKHLPRKNRGDIEAEIRSTLEDMLEERKQAEGPASEAEMAALLKEYGSPREVAAKYKSHQYLIGPGLFPLFEMIARIVFIVLAAVSILGLAVSLAKTGFANAAFLPALQDWFLNLIGGLVAAFGNIALAFAIIERLPAARKFEEDAKEWDPKELKEEHDPDLIDLPDHIATIVFTVLGLVILNLYPNLLAIRFINNGEMTSAPIFTEAFFRFLPWINVMGALLIAFNGFMLSRKEWQTSTRILSIVMDVAQTALSVVILTTPAIFAISPEALRAAGAQESAEALSQLANFVPTIILVIVVVITAIKMIKSAWQLLQGRTKSPYPIVK